MDEKVCFVQFLHPGGEHRPPSGRNMPWNVGDHRRKFIVSAGEARDRSTRYDGELEFWGEWEPQSRIRSRFPQNGNGYPRYLHEPYCSPVDGWVQNTDPFVFGDAFKYTGCQQHRGGFPTQLRYLARGSVILFGSYKAGRFLLDTVFVVDRQVDHDAHSFEDLRDIVSRLYWHAVITPWYRGRLAEGQSNRLYFGATPTETVDGMFSFVPCRPREDGNAGFVRPSITMPDLVNPNHKQSYKKNTQPSVAAVRPLWDEVADQVLDQGLLLGTRFAEPPIEPVETPG